MATLTDAQKEKLVRLGQLAKFKILADSAYQATISDLSTIRSGAAAGATAYQKPGTGIPATDLAEAVQTALSSAGTALQPSDLTTLNGKVAALEALIGEDTDGAINKFNEIVAFLENVTDQQTLEGIISGLNTSIAAKYTKPSGGIPSTDLSSDVQASLAKADSALQAADIAGKADKATTLAGYGITDANIANGVITLGSNSITPLTSHQDISGKKNVQTAVGDPTASGNAAAFIDTISQNTNGEITVTKKNVQSASGSQAGLMSAAHYTKVESIDYASDSDVEAIFA